MPLLTLPRIEQRLAQHRPVVLDPASFSRQAAVAVILRERGDVTEALFIKRAQRPGDLWSGHMAFPGGHWESGDADLAATAMRETAEEIGLDLARHGRLLGHLDHMNVNPIGTRHDMLIVPYVSPSTARRPRSRPTTRWPTCCGDRCTTCCTGRSATRRDMHVRGGLQPFPGYGVRDEIVWGLTYRMLHGFFAVLDPAWRIPRS